MKITTLIVALIGATALAAFGQEGTAQDIKQGAKKAGEKVELLICPSSPTGICNYSGV